MSQKGRRYTPEQIIGKLREVEEAFQSTPPHGRRPELDRVRGDLLNVRPSRGADWARRLSTDLYHGFHGGRRGAAVMIEG
jgi:hypothetical protein